MPTTDLPIPPAHLIEARAMDTRASAVRLGDNAAVRQLDTLLANIGRARFRWELGVLIVGSPSGFVYRVTNAGCDCLNGQAGKHDCWHFKAHNILLEMFSEEVETADQAADEAAAARALLAERIEATAQTLAAMRARLGRRIAMARQVYV